jgi:hypothetical protein
LKKISYEIGKLNRFPIERCDSFGEAKKIRNRYPGAEIFKVTKESIKPPDDKISKMRYQIDYLEESVRKFGGNCYTTGILDALKMGMEIIEELLEVYE